jgi:UDP-glucuronate 4-epimerase
MVVVTGVAGFIGSRLARRLVCEGVTVHGVDAFTDYYPESLKRANVAPLLRSPLFSLHESTAGAIPVEVLDGASWVAHLAAQPGVRASWGATFERYVEHNVLEAQRLLEALAATSRRPRLIVSSSSSVYGPTTGPVREDTPRRPVSPYGVTKKASEDLLAAYADRVDAVALRFFTVYGPGQRPDMAIHRLIAAARDGGSFDVFGDGGQRRDFTYVDDAVEAMVRTAGLASPRPVYNVGGGQPHSVLEAAELVAEAVARRPTLRFQPAMAGDVRSTHADCTALERDAGWRPAVSLAEGIARQVTAVTTAAGGAPCAG